MSVHGSCSEQFEDVRTELSISLESGADIGASVAVCIDGEVRVDLWGGSTDPDLCSPWEPDTLINVFSMSKTVLGLAAITLQDSGLIKADETVATYWPEFGTDGKEDITIRHVLSHTSGLPGWTTKVQVKDLYDWDLATCLLARETPWWRPGESAGYHALTQGYILGEVVRRVTGQTIGDFVQKEIFGRIGGEFYYSVPKSLRSRLAPVLPPRVSEGGVPGATLIGTPMANAVLANPIVTAHDTWEAEWRRAEIPSAGGCTNARSIALAHSAVACLGVVSGTRLFSERSANAAMEVSFSGVDCVLDRRVRYGNGFAFDSETLPLGKGCLGGAGLGGSLVCVDPNRRLVVAYVMNQMRETTTISSDGRGLGIMAAVRRSLDR